jgi:hypothetical protein
MAEGLGLTATPESQGLGIMETAQKEYPILQGLDLGYKYNPGGGKGFLEFWPSNEMGTPDAPRPKEFKPGQLGLEVYDPKTRPIDILGDVASHHLVQTDPTMKAFYDQFAQSLTPEQMATLKQQYQYAKQNEGETRPYEQWHEKTGLPAYFRGYAFDQWPDSQSMYTPAQLKMFDRMMTHLKKKR